MILHLLKRFFTGGLCILLAFSCLKASQAQEDEKTYAISLVKTVETEGEIRAVDDRKVLTETHVVRDGEWIWQILRERKLLERRNLGELISILKKLNASLTNLDLIEPGQKIVIPLRITPLTGMPVAGTIIEEQVATPVDLKDVKFENYTVRPGDSMIKVVEARYRVPPEKLYSDYLDLAKRLNPAIKNMDIIYPGQVIRLPIFSGQVIRKPIERAVTPKPPERPVHEEEKLDIHPLADDLRAIFTALGEEWVQTGNHFIPLKSAGQVDLKASSFPIIKLRNGLNVIVDLHNGLPDKMAELIEANWGNYRIVKLGDEHNLRAALNRLLPACNYPKLFKRGESFRLEGEISVSIKGDWVVVMQEPPSFEKKRAAVITLREDGVPMTPQAIKDYLEGEGVTVIDYPRGSTIDQSEPMRPAESLEGVRDPSTLIRTLLSLTAQHFSTDEGIPIYEKKGADYKLVVKADFLVKIEGKDAVVDLSGLAPELVSLLEQQDVGYLSLGNLRDPMAIVSKTLDFIDVVYQAGPHEFMGTARDESRNITVTLNGVVFPDADGEPVFATPVAVPYYVGSFLAEKGLQVLPLSF